MAPESADLYKSDKYQRTNDIESRTLHGLPIDQRNELEVAQAIDALALNIEPGDRLLDLACGTGGHARLLREKLGIDIDARDTSEPSLSEAQRIERDIQNARNGTRGSISFANGDYGKIKESVPQNTKYRAITILGNSFMYLPTAEDHQRAMQDFYELLAPGGKIVIQFRDRENRQRDPQQMAKWCQELNVECESRPADGKVGKSVQPGQNIDILRDTKEGDGFYYHGYENLPPASDGTSRSSFRKVYFDKDGNEEDMGSTTTINYISKEHLPELQALMEKAGLENVSIQHRSMSPDGSVWSYAIVGEKPNSDD
jgi:SAM-dependent methyltransferase